MNAKKKALALVLCALMLVAASVFGTLAYLTDTENVVTNTFTVGNVTITLDEAKVNPYGQPLKSDGAVAEDASDIARAESGNVYKLIPGHTYTKDPIIHVASDSESCYLFVEIVNGISGIEIKTEEENKKKIDSQMEDKGWIPVSEETNVYYYGNKETKVATVVDAGNNVPVFDNFTIDNGEKSFTNYANANIKVTAYAIQSDGFANVNDAWTALKKELPTNP